MLYYFSLGKQFFSILTEPIKSATDTQLDLQKLQNSMDFNGYHPENNLKFKKSQRLSLQD